MNLYNCTILICSTVLFLLAITISIRHSYKGREMLILNIGKDYCFIPPQPFTTVLFLNDRLQYYTLYNYGGYCGDNLRTGVIYKNSKKFRNCLLPEKLIQLMFSTGRTSSILLPDYVLNMDDLCEFAQKIIKRNVYV